jgi:aminoglycoside phosphotransferase (APT) family kinase protein
LAGSASGSLVVLVRLGDEELVLKTATARETAFYRAAAAIPVRVPRVVASDGTGLLLEALTPLPPATDWPEARWHEVAHQLGALHHADVAAAIGDQPWLKPATAADRRPDATARAFWTADELALLDDIEPVDLQPCLVHGDVHAGNLLLDRSNDLVWADWQEVGIGAGPADLALLWQRAEFDGADPPRAAMLASYAEARGIPCDSELVRATTAAELRLLLLDWPPFLTRAEPARASVMRQRLHALRQRS